MQIWGSRRIVSAFPPIRPPNLECFVVDAEMVILFGHGDKDCECLIRLKEFQMFAVVIEFVPMRKIALN
jgi:hypothetical protein